MRIRTVLMTCGAGFPGRGACTLQRRVSEYVDVPFPRNPDHYSGFVAKPEEYDFKFLGEKQMLAPMHAE